MTDWFEPEAFDNSAGWMGNAVAVSGPGKLALRRMRARLQAQMKPKRAKKSRSKKAKK